MNLKGYSISQDFGLTVDCGSSLGYHSTLSFGVWPANLGIKEYMLHVTNQVTYEVNTDSTSKEKTGLTARSLPGILLELPPRPRPSHPTGILEVRENSIVFMSAEKMVAEMQI